MPLKYNNKIIAKKIIYCDSFLKKATGLMFRTPYSVKNSAWIFRFKKPVYLTITMFFVFFPIDVILLDKTNKVIGVMKNLRLFKNYDVDFEVSSFVELRSGSIDRFKIKKGGKFEF